MINEEPKQRTLYPHEIVASVLNKNNIKIKSFLKPIALVVGFAMLIISTAITTLLFLVLPSEPKVYNGVISGIIITGIIGFALQLMFFEPTQKEGYNE